MRRRGAGAQAIWDWSTIERVSTGLLLLRLGEESESREYLGAAELLATANGPSVAASYSQMRLGCRSIDRPASRSSDGVARKRRTITPC